MAAQSSMFSTRSSWHHFIGGFYKSTDRFIAEARRLGISRRVPAKVARGMHFGDRIVLLRWLGKDPAGRGRVEAFAECTITGITLADGIGAEVGRQLADEGRASFDGGGGVVQRDCGFYMVTGGWSVEADLPELIERAQAIADERGVELFCMVPGRLDQVYESPALLSPAPAFHRGFSRIADADASFEYQPPSGALVLVNGYQKAKR